MSDYFLKFDNVSFSYRKSAVIEFPDIEIASMGITLLKGPSGAGKTTALRLISGIEKPKSGKILGEVSRVSYVFQDQRLLPWLDGIDNIKSVCPEIDEKRVSDLLFELGLTAAIQRKRVTEISGGQRQRINIARALAYDGDILLLDEPFTGLDDENRNVVLEKIFEFKKRKPVVLVSHSERDFEIADRVFEMS